MTPAVQHARKAGIPFETASYAADPRAPSYGEEAARALGVAPARVFKTLVVDLGADGVAVAVVPVSGSLDLRAVAVHFGAKRAALADPVAAERLTGYVVGGISPLGQRRRLPLVLDSSAAAYPTIYVSAGRRGLEIILAPDDLLTLCEGTYGAVSTSGRG